MPALSFSCEEKKQALIDHKCQQTIRPETERIKVGDRLKIFSHQRAKKMCSTCLDKSDYEICPMAHYKEHRPYGCDHFNNVIGYGKATEVFDISMMVFTGKLEFSIQGDKIYDREDIEDLAKKDGFKSVWDFVKWFDTHYDFWEPLEFTVIRWEWITEEEYNGN